MLYWVETWRKSWLRCGTIKKMLVLKQAIRWQISRLLIWCEKGEFYEKSSWWGTGWFNQDCCQWHWSVWWDGKPAGDGRDKKSLQHIIKELWYSRYAKVKRLAQNRSNWRVHKTSWTTNDKIRFLLLIQPSNLYTK